MGNAASIATAAAMAAGLWLAPTAVQAHAFAERYDLPLPLWLYLVGAGAGVVLSFVLAAAFARGAGSMPSGWHVAVPVAIVDGLARGLAAFGVAALVLLLAAGWFGEQGDWDSNLLPVVVWVIWWVGLTFVCALVGDVWPALDPWRTVGRFVARNRRPIVVIPDRVGRWPAVALFAAFCWAELIWTENAVPWKLASLVAVWSGIAWATMALAGTEAWRRHFDPFTTVFGLFGRFAPLAIVRDGDRARLVVRAFGAGLRETDPPSASTTAFIILAIATVGFDGVSETPFWDAVVGVAMGWLYEAGVVHAIGYVRAGNLIEAVGLYLTPLLFAAVYLAVAAVTGRIVGEAAGTVARRFVLTLVPIAVAYHLSHYLSYLLIQGQMVLPLLSDPLNRGWDLFGTRAMVPDIAIIDMGFVWTSAVIAIVVGHVASVVLAHGEAARAYGPLATVSQGPMLVLMVAYTMLSLWILAQPIVTVG
jgi:hypothetical protein